MQNLGSSACGCREHAVSAVVEFGGSFRAGLGCARLGSLTAARTRREGFSLLAAAPNAGITLPDRVDIYEQGRASGFWETR
jgi:hypothetical protein